MKRAIGCTFGIVLWLFLFWLVHIKMDSYRMPEPYTNLSEEILGFILFLVVMTMLGTVWNKWKNR